MAWLVSAEIIQLYFMNVAILKAKTRHNYKNQAGACIINAQNKIVGIGNYTELRSKKSDLFSWFKKSKTDYGRIFFYTRDNLFLFT